MNALSNLVLKLPLPPGCSSSIWNDPNRFFKAYLEKYKGYYNTSDAGVIDKDGYIILIDFQFVKKLKKNEKTYTFLGTPEYMAPEIVTKKGYNWYSDNYALGIFIYELELGYSPFLCILIIEPIEFEES